MAEDGGDAVLVVVVEDLLEVEPATAVDFEDVAVVVSEEVVEVAAVAIIRITNSCHPALSHMARSSEGKLNFVTITPSRECFTGQP